MYKSASSNFNRVSQIDRMRSGIRSPKNVADRGTIKPQTSAGAGTTTVTRRAGEIINRNVA